MVWKSNLAEQDQEFIEDLGGTLSSAGQANQPSVSGGITSNRKSKVVG